MRKEIDRVLGNSLRCILPSYWWKRLLGMLADKIESAEESAASAFRIAMLAGSEAANKQDRLVSGSNIKTINNQSILGSGNLKIETQGAIVSRELYAVGLQYGQTGGRISELTQEMKDYNKVTKQLFLEGKADVRIVYQRDGLTETFPVWHYYNYYESFYFAEPFDHSPSTTRLQIAIHCVRVKDDGTATWERYDMAPDWEVLADSYNAVSGKAVAAAINTKADKTDIKTINGVSLLGGGNLQLGDEQTFVYDDTELMEIAKDAKADALEAKALVRFIENEMDALAEELSALTSRVKALEDK